MTGPGIAATPNPQWVDVAGVATHYVDCGAGEPVVLMHGGAFSSPACWNLFGWEHNIAGLCEEFRVIAFDSLGQGGTAGPSDDADYTLDAVVRHAREFLAALQVRRAHLVGHDHGGMVALRLAFTAPELVASCTITSSPSVAPTGDELPNYTLAGRMAPHYGREDQEWVLDRLSYSPHHIASGRFVNEMLAVAGSAEFKSARLRIQERQLLDRYLRPSLAKLKSDTFARVQGEGTPVPTLIVWGQQDPICPMQAALVLFDLIARRQRVTQLRVINHAGYLPFREQPGVFNAMVAGFLRGLKAS